MPAKLYPFIDIAVHKSVRAHFARGDAAVLFSPDMASILWSNGQGADLFGFASIYDFLDTGAPAADVTYRQLQTAARQVKATGDQRSFTIRTTAGFKSVVLNASVEHILIRPGEEAILFTVPRAGKILSAEACAQQMISGFDDPDTHMAVLAETGDILAASEGFSKLDMTPQTRRLLVAAVARDSDWLVKRPVPTGRGHLPAAIGKLSESPALHLLFAVETILGHMDASVEFETAEAMSETMSAAPVAMVAVDPPADIESPTPLQQAVPSGGDATGMTADAMTEDTGAEDTGAGTAFADSGAEAERVEPASDDGIGDSGSQDSQPAAHDDATPDVAGDARLEPPEEAPLDSAVSLVNEADAEAVEPTVARAVSGWGEPAPDGADFVFNPTQRAARFVWKIDANGQFSEISSEFAAAVGPDSADVVGKSFESLAERYGFDQDNVIGGLLKRRDTWSGKMILWPVQGTTLVAPVDLAALPTYSRNRTFDGFRGFGIVRVADAIEDPNETGLSLGAFAEPQGEPVCEPSAAPAADNDVPVLDTIAQDDTPEIVDPDLFSTLAAPPSADVADLFEDPFRGEQPALKFRSGTAPAASENVVMIDDHRIPTAESLTRAEQAAFREIARALGETVGIDRQDPQPATEKPKPATEAAKTSDAVLPPQDAPTDPLPTEMTAADAAETEQQDPEDSQEVNGQDVEKQEETPEVDAISDLAPAEILPALPKHDEPARLTPGLLDGLPMALLVHVGDELIHANSEFLRLTGYASLQTLDEEGGIDALFASADELDVAAPDGAMMLIRHDGHLIPVLARLQSIRWDERSVLLMALAAVPMQPAADEPTDVAAEPEAEPEDTDRQMASEQLRVETEELRSILETATDGVVVVGTDGDIRSLNRSANALFNYDDSDIRGKPFAMLFAHESQKSVLDYLAGLAGHGVASVLNDGREVIGREASGGFIPLFMTMGRLSSSNGYCAVIRDITQWKRTEEELRNAKRAAETANAHKTDFLARVSHEIRTPLNAIIGFSDMMASEHFGPIGNPRYVEYASDIGRSGRHVLDIVNDLLDISKIEAGEMDLEFSAVEINDAVSEAVSLVQPQANGQRVIIRTSLSASVPSIVADSRSIKQIALNILANAIRFTPSGGQIVVSTAYEPNGSVILRIRDTGIGMTRTELEQAMKPFRQVSTSGRQRGDGTGLGLPLTKAMAEANRALFSINSAPNEGTLVEICFPSQRVLAD